MYAHISMCEHVLTMEDVWKSEDSSWESALSFHYVSLGIKLLRLPDLAAMPLPIDPSCLILQVISFLFFFLSVFQDRVSLCNSLAVLELTL